MVKHVPRTEDTVSDILHMLRKHGFEKSFFIGHSFGTAVYIIFDGFVIISHISLELDALG
jgi:pimeloyl-ACP methyl ester carboxylesterase